MNKNDQPDEEKPSHDLSALLADSVDSYSIPSTQTSSEHPGTTEDDDEWGLLRALLMDGYENHLRNLISEIVDVQQEIVVVREKLDNIGEQFADEEALLETINPVIASSIRDKIKDSRSEMIEVLSPIMADTIRANIRDSKEEMVEALFPLVGQLVQRSVREAINSLASRIDHQLQTRFSYRTISRDLQAMITGVSRAELTLRDSLPFDATDLFLIHRDSGLLLAYVTDAILDLNPTWASLNTLEDAQEDHIGSGDVIEYQSGDYHPIHHHYDSDLISGMLTAIRDFVDDAFGRGEGGSLDQVDYGKQKILIETAENVYMAIVVEGTAPFEFRGAMRACLMELQHEFSAILQDYDGDASPFESKKAQLQGLLTDFDNVHDISGSDRPGRNAPIPDSAQVQYHPTSNSTTLSPMSILLIINAIIFVFWWFLT